MCVEIEARTIVELIRAQDFSGALVIDGADAVQLVATALRVAEGRGYIDGINRMGEIADRALAPARMA